MEQPKAYKELWKKVAEEYQEKNSELEWVPECEEINLWTYWQGRGHYTPAVMVAGQDWGQGNNKAGLKFRENAEKMNRNQECSIFSGLEEKEMFPTDQNLIRLFKSMNLGYDSIERRQYEDLFFTNICLGYRVHGSSGNFRKLWREHEEKDREHFRKLVSVLKPAIILCLGKDTFLSVVRALEGTRIRITKAYNYNQCIADNCPRRILTKEGEVQVFALAHPGRMGTLNRNGGKSGTSLARQEEDWKKVAEAIENCRKKRGD